MALEVLEVGLGELLELGPADAAVAVEDEGDGQVAAEQLALLLGLEHLDELLVVGAVGQLDGGGRHDVGEVLVRLARVGVVLELDRDEAGRRRPASALRSNMALKSRRLGLAGRTRSPWVDEVDRAATVGPPAAAEANLDGRLAGGRGSPSSLASIAGEIWSPQACRRSRAPSPAAARPPRGRRSARS